MYWLCATAVTLLGVVIGIAVLALILFRQMQVRPVRASFRLPLILAIIGVVELTQFLHPTTTTTPARSSPRSRAAWSWPRSPAPSVR